MPLFDLSLEPAVRRRQPGLVSVIVVPDGAVSRLTPDSELLRQVRQHLDGCRNTATDLVVVGPEYVEIDVELEVAVGDANVAGDVSRMLKVSIEAFLHPLSGGQRGEGWRLGELPERGDLYALCASTPGVTWVDVLRVTHREDRGERRHLYQAPINLGAEEGVDSARLKLPRPGRDTSRHGAGNVLILLPQA